MSSVIAAVAHDLDHPGVTQAFLVATSNHLVNLYNVIISFYYCSLTKKKILHYIAYSTFKTNAVNTKYGSDQIENQSNLSSEFSKMN